MCLQEFTSLIKILSPVLDHIIFGCWHTRFKLNILIKNSIGLVFFIYCYLMYLEIRFLVHVILNFIVLHTEFWTLFIEVALHVTFEHLVYCDLATSARSIHFVFIMGFSHGAGFAIVTSLGQNCLYSRYTLSGIYKSCLETTLNVSIVEILAAESCASLGFHAFANKSEFTLHLPEIYGASTLDTALATSRIWSFDFPSIVIWGQESAKLVSSFDIG